MFKEKTMHFKDYSVVISQGVEIGDGYVKMKHRQQYVISLRNRKNSRCNALVMVDGKEIGAFRLNGYGHTELERPPNDTGRFTFYRAGSSEAKRAGLGSVSEFELGLIQVTFTPEKKPGYQVEYWAETGEPAADAAITGDLGVAGATPRSSYNAGGTGLSGHSGQGFVNVAEMNLDYDNAVTISLRLIADDNEIRPLMPTQSKNQTIVPPPVK